MTLRACSTVVPLLNIMSPNRTLLLVLTCSLYLSPATCLNILGLFPHLGKSHFDVFEPLLKALAEKGHNLTIISHFPQKTQLPRYDDISLQGEALRDFISVTELPKKPLIYYFSSILLLDLADISCKSLHLPQMKEFLNADHKFDLIITEMFNTECFLGFVHKYQIPFIGLSSCTVMPWTNNRFGNPINPSYVPMNLLPYSDSMSFFGRVENTVYYIYLDFLFKFFMEPAANKEAKAFFGDDLPPLNEIASNASLLLVNSHFSLNRPRPLVPSVIELGGMFLPKVKPVPENIEKFINDSPHGVIYFSMGSLVKTQTFPEETRTAFLNAFAKLKQRVLWKWENESLPGQPDNVMIQKWMPQFDVLCHPNVVAFISHGGLLGTTEAVHCGVPIVVMPQFGDQFTNAKAIEANGGGIILQLDEATEETVLDALNTVLEPSFSQSVKELSEAFRDRPLPPLDTAIYWVEYVARHKGAHFMRSAAVHMPFYQYLLLDVIAFISFIVFMFFTTVWFCLKTTKHLLFAKSNKEKLQ